MHEAQLNLLLVLPKISNISQMMLTVVLATVMKQVSNKLHDVKFNGISQPPNSIPSLPR